MTDTPFFTAYKWGLELARNRGIEAQDDSDKRALIVEDVMRDWDMENPDVLTDDQWDDVSYAINEYFNEMLG